MPNGPWRLHSLIFPCSWPTHWTLRDKANHIYVFPAFALKAHKPVEIHTGTGKNNGGKETAALKSAAGKTVGARSYTGRSVSGAAQAIFKP